MHMNRNEITFFAIAAATYILSASALNVSSFVHVVFAIGILAAIIIAIALKFKPKFENEKAGKISQSMLIIALISYALAMISELWFGKTLIIDSGILLFAVAILIAVNWFFKKRNVNG